MIAYFAALLGGKDYHGNILLKEYLVCYGWVEEACEDIATLVGHDYELNILRQH